MNTRHLIVETDEGWVYDIRDPKTKRSIGYDEVPKDGNNEPYPDATDEREAFAELFA